MPKLLPYLVVYFYLGATKRQKGMKKGTIARAQKNSFPTYL